MEELASTLPHQVGVQETPVCLWHTCMGTERLGYTFMVARLLACWLPWVQHGSLQLACVKASRLAMHLLLSYICFEVFYQLQSALVDCARALACCRTRYDMANGSTVLSTLYQVRLSIRVHSCKHLYAHVQAASLVHVA